MTYDILIMQSVERKRRVLYKKIRMSQLQEYFQRIRDQKLKAVEQSEEIEVQIIESFINQFPKHIEKVCLYYISGDLLAKLTQMPHNWLQKQQRKLNICEWASLILLFINIFKKIKDTKVRLDLLSSAKDIICSNFQIHFKENKMMKRQILSLMIDFFLEINQDIMLIVSQYLSTLKILLNELFLTKFEEYSSQIIKTFAICNFLINSNRYELEQIMGLFFYHQKWVVFKIIAFIESFGMMFKDQKTNVLLQIMLIFLINLTEHTKTAKFYELFIRKQFLALVQNILSYSNDIQHQILKLYLKLMFNLIISSNIFSKFISKIINFNDIYAKISSEQEEQLLKDLEEVLSQEILQ